MYSRLKQLRKKSNLTKTEISNYLNISIAEYSLYESGKVKIPINILSSLARKYNTSIDYIIGDTNNSQAHLKNKSERK